MNNVAIFTFYKCHVVLWSCLCMLREEPETPAAVFELYSAEPLNAVERKANMWIKVKQLHFTSLLTLKFIE